MSEGSGFGSRTKSASEDDGVGDGAATNEEVLSKRGRARTIDDDDDDDDDAAAGGELGISSAAAKAKTNNTRATIRAP